MFDITDDVIFNQCFDFFEKHFELEVTQDKNVFLSLYQISKLHQNSTKPNFIITFPISSKKRLAKCITSVFKGILQIVQNYRNKCYFSGKKLIGQFYMSKQ